MWMIETSNYDTYEFLQDCIDVFSQIILALSGIVFIKSMQNHVIEWLATAQCTPSCLKGNIIVNINSS